jgi:hypothetical protein
MNAANRMIEATSPLFLVSIHYLVIWFCCVGGEGKGTWEKGKVYGHSSRQESSQQAHFGCPLQFDVPHDWDWQN